MQTYIHLYQMILEKLILLFLLFLVMDTILDSPPDLILQFRNPGVWSCFMWVLTTIGAGVLEKKLLICYF